MFAGTVTTNGGVQIFSKIKEKLEFFSPEVLHEARSHIENTQQILRTYIALGSN
jgi:hypothetical protein